MDESIKNELKIRIESYLEAIESGASQAGEFVLKETPLVAQEYLAWTFWSSTLSAGTSFAVAVLSILVVKRLWGWVTKDAENHECAPLLVFPFGVLIPSIAIFGTNAAMALKVSVAPRVVLLEKIGEMIQ